MWSSDHNEIAEAMKHSETRSRLDFLISRACSLREACQEVGHDESGRRCPTMPGKAPVQRRAPVAGAAEAQVNTQAQLTDPREAGPQNSAFIIARLECSPASKL